jgi:hypothetical protein
MKTTAMPIKVKQTDGTVKVVTKEEQRVAAGTGLKAVRALALALAPELPLCQDCKERRVTGVGMKYCEPCK